ncbi:MAG: hypothetical protein WA799_01490 [Nitrosotalea sp.]
MSFEDELEKWIITYLVAHPDNSITAGVVIHDVPRDLVNRIKSDEVVFLFLMKMEAKGIIQRGVFYNFKLTSNGLLYFRKFIEPLFTIAKNKDRYSTIIDQTEGKSETRKQFKKLLSSIKNRKPDEAERIIIKFLIEEGLDMIWYLVKLIFTAHGAS